MAQPIGDAGSSMQPAALVSVPLPEPLATEHAAFTVASTSTTALATTKLARTPDRSQLAEMAAQQLESPRTFGLVAPLSWPGCRLAVCWP